MNALIKYLFRAYYPGVIFGLIILAISLMPVSADGQPLIFSFPGADKVVHAAIYCIFTILLMKDFLLNKPMHRIKFPLLLLSILFYSIIIEIIQQSLTEYRSGELLDVIANLLGILVGTGLVLLYRKIKY